MTQELIAAIAVFIISGLCAVLSVRSFMQKGFLFNNAWIWATQEQKEHMDKSPYYRQSAIVFLLLAAVFAFEGLNLITERDFWFGAGIGVTIVAVVYAAVSSVIIEKHKRK